MLQVQLCNEKDLLFKMSQGCEHSYTCIYNFYKPPLYRRLLKLLRSHSYACEIIQDVFLKIWELRKTIDPAKSFRSYLFKIAENAVRDIFRRTQNEKRAHTSLLRSGNRSYSHIEEDVIVKENAAILTNVIKSLPDQRRRVLCLCKLEGKSYKEVSAMLNISESTISDHIVKATNYIRKTMRSPVSGA